MFEGTTLVREHLRFTSKKKKINKKYIYISEFILYIIISRVIADQEYLGLHSDRIISTVQCLSNSFGVLNQEKSLYFYSFLEESYPF